MFSYLLYGDYITINSSFLSKQNTKVEGSLSAKGIFDSHVYFQTHPLNEKELSQISVTTNHRDMVFQVWPFISFQASKLLGKLEAQKQLIKIKQANNPQGDQFKFQEFFFFLCTICICCFYFLLLFIFLILCLFFYIVIILLLFLLIIFFFVLFSIAVCFLFFIFLFIYSLFYLI